MLEIINPFKTQVNCYLADNKTDEKYNLSQFYNFSSTVIVILILLHEKFLQFDWLRAVVFQLNLKYLHVKITNLLWVVV